MGFASCRDPYVIAMKNIDGTTPTPFSARLFAKQNCVYAFLLLGLQGTEAQYGFRRPDPAKPDLDLTSTHIQGQLYDISWAVNRAHHHQPSLMIGTLIIS
jgi:hypothetical protein